MPTVDESLLSLPDYVPLFIGNLELEGMSPAELGAYSMLHLSCDWGTGIWRGTAETLSHCFGGGRYSKAIQDNLGKMKGNGLIWYPDGHGSMGGHSILINKYMVWTGPLRGYVLNAFAFKTEDDFGYELPDLDLGDDRRLPGGRPVATGVTTDGCRTFSRLSSDGRLTDTRPYQELNNLTERFQRIVVRKTSAKKSPRAND